MTLDDDVSSAVNAARRDRHIGVSEAVNELIRRGLTVPQGRRGFQQRTAAMGLRVDVDNIGDALQLLDGVRSR